jgi:hypothetical protein
MKAVTTYEIYYKFQTHGTEIMNNEKYSLHLNEIKKNLAGDQSTLFAIFPLSFVPFMQYAG